MKKKLLTPKFIKRALVLIGSGAALYLGAKYKIDPAPFIDLLNNL